MMWSTIIMIIPGLCSPQLLAFLSRFGWSLQPVSLPLQPFFRTMRKLYVVRINMK